MWSTGSQGIFQFSLNIEDPTNLKLGRYCWLYSASKKISFGFCSCSELLQLKSFANALTEKPISQPLRQLQGGVMWQIRQFVRPYNYVETLQCALLCFECGLLEVRRRRRKKEKTNWPCLGHKLYIFCKIFNKNWHFQVIRDTYNTVFFQKVT